jgi:NAD dependent epimerase/dehydratase family enzyme
MKIILPGGSGQIGTILARHLHTEGHDVLVLSRAPKPAPWRTMQWDGRTRGPWTSELDGADAVIHLSGRSVNCRYTPANRRAIFDSRTVPTTLLGQVIAEARNPPRLWLNASTSTYYRHALDRPGIDHANDEFTGELGDLPSERGTREPASLPETWSFSIDVATRWEQAFRAASTPHTRKITLRSSMVMSPDPGGVFSVLSRLVRAGLGGAQGPGTQYVSWIHDQDYCRAIDLLLALPEITDSTSGIVNLTAPNPLPNRDFMRELRRAWHVPIGLPAASWMLELGAIFLRTETELILKSRRVVPTILLRAGFQFAFPTWPEAARDLVGRSRS